MTKEQRKKLKEFIDGILTAYDAGDIEHDDAISDIVNFVEKL